MYNLHDVIMKMKLPKLSLGFSSAHFFRLVRIFVLLCIVSSIFSVSVGDLLITDANARFCGPGDDPVTNGCTVAPEIPALLVPLFLLISAGSFYFIRRRSLNLQ